MASHLVAAGPINYAKHALMMEGGAMAQVRLADVARAAGVSVATASRALHGAVGRSVRPELAAKVRQAATELGYLPDAAAQAMVRGRSSTIGLIVHDIADPQAAAIAAGVIAGAAEAELLVSVTATGYHAEVEAQQIAAFRTQRARAVILAGSRFADLPSTFTQELDRYLASGGQVVTVGQHLHGLPAVLTDDRRAAAELAETLWMRGYRTFAVLGGPEDLHMSTERLEGFTEGLHRRGGDLEAGNVLTTSVTRDGGFVAMTEFMQRGIDADAIFAVDDMIAVGALAALTRNGFRVGTDIGLAGFGDIPVLRDIAMPLTTISVPLAAIARAALDLALGRGTDPVQLRCGLAVRASTPPRTV